MSTPLNITAVFDGATNTDLSGAVQDPATRVFELAVVTAGNIRPWTFPPVGARDWYLQMLSISIPAGGTVTVSIAYPSGERQLVPAEIEGTNSVVTNLLVPQGCTLAIATLDNLGAPAAGTVRMWIYGINDKNYAPLAGHQILSPADATGAGTLKWSAATVQLLEAITSANGLEAGDLAVVTGTGNIYEATTATVAGSTWQPSSGVRVVTDYGAVGDDATVATTAIQAALDGAVNAIQVAGQTGRAHVLVPLGIFVIDAPLVVPHGVSFTGVGSASSLVTYGSKLRLADGSDSDMIRFTGDGSDFIHDVEIAYLALDGNTANQVSGHGIATVDAGGGGLIPGQNFRIHDISIRLVKENGIEIQRRALPLLLADMFIWDCDGFGINLDPSEGISQMVSFDNVSLDDNALGGIRIDNLAGSGADVFIFRSVKLEKSQNGRQDNHIILKDMGSASVVVQGASMVESGGAADAASLIRIEGATQPGYVSLDGVDVRNATTPVIDDIVAGLAVPAQVKQATYQPAVNYRAGTLVGAAPLFHLFNLGGAADAKRTRISQSATALEIFGVSDAGATGTKLWTGLKDGTGWVSFTPNTILVEAGTVAVDQDTTPSVARVNELRTANTIGTSITFFDDGLVGQELTVIFTDGITTVVASASMKLAGGVNFVATANDVLTLRRIAGGVWLEKSRSVNA